MVVMMSMPGLCLQFGSSSTPSQPFFVHRSRPALQLLYTVLLLLVVGSEAACPTGWPDSTGACAYCWPQFVGPTCSTACACRLGTCANGTTSAGHCTGTCSRPNVTGENCDQCTAGMYGPICQFTCPSCVHGSCDQGIGGTGRCVCQSGWFGRLCNSNKRSRTMTPTIVTTRPPTPTPTNVTRAPVTTASQNATSNATTTAAIVTTQAPVTFAPVAIKCTTAAIAVTLTFPSSVDASRISSAVAAVALVPTSQVSTWAPSASNAVGANYVVQTAFVAPQGGGNTTVAAMQQLYVRLLTALTYNVSNPVARLGLVSFTVVCEAVATTAPDNTTTAVPRAPPTPGSGGSDFPSYAIVLISLAIVIVLAALVGIPWYLYTRWLRRKELKDRVKAAQEQRQRDLEMTRLAGEATALDMDSGTLGDGNPRKVRFGGMADLSALPMAPLAADDEFVSAPTVGGGRPAAVASRNAAIQGQSDVVPVDTAVMGEGDGEAELLDPNDVEFDALDLGTSAVVVTAVPMPAAESRQEQMYSPTDGNGSADDGLRTPIDHALSASPLLESEQRPAPVATVGPVVPTVAQPSTPRAAMPSHATPPPPRAVPPRAAATIDLSDDEY